MKRFILIMSCISIFYAGAVWALEGCLDFEKDVHPAHQAGKFSHNHHDAEAGSHHSHTDPSKIHCPNVLGEFLISSRVSLSADNSYLHHAAHDVETGSGLSHSIALAEGGGPPGLIHSKTFPRHLLFSVIRI